MFYAHDVGVMVEREHAHRVAVRLEDGFNEQAGHVLAGLHFHPSGGHQRLGRVHGLRRNALEHAQKRVWVAARRAHGGAQRHAALVRPGNAHAHGVFVEIGIQRNRDMF